MALDVIQGVWVQSAYLMGNAVMGFMWLKIRQHYSLQKFVRWTLLMMFASNVLQAFGNHYQLELIARFIMGVGTNGLLTLGMFYAMQTFRAGKALIPLALSAGLMQAVSSLCYMISPSLLADGNVQAIFVFQLAMTLICLSAVLWLPLPKGHHEPSLSWQDWLTFVLFATGMALLCGYLSLGNVLWWTTDWLGFLLAFGVGLIGLAFWFEAGRERPLINWHWVSARQIAYLMLMAMMTRLFTTEQSVGAGGVLNLMGLSSEQLYDYYKIIFIASLAGLVMSIVTLNPKDVRKNTVFALLGIAIFGAYVNIKTQEHLSNLTAHIVLDNGTITAQNTNSAVRFANLEARILAYNDLFSAIWLVASALFFVAFLVWAYRRYHKIDVIEKEMAVVAQLLAK